MISDACCSPDCLQDNVAFLSSVYDDLIGLADRDGLLLYSLHSHSLRRADLDLTEAARRAGCIDESGHRRSVSGNAVLIRGRQYDPQLKQDWMNLPYYRTILALGLGG
jgi:hypothetical protein